MTFQNAKKDIPGDIGDVGQAGKGIDIVGKVSDIGNGKTILPVQPLYKVKVL